MHPAGLRKGVTGLSVDHARRVVVRRWVAAAAAATTAATAAAVTATATAQGRCMAVGAKRAPVHIEQEAHSRAKEADRTKPSEQCQLLLGLARAAIRQVKHEDREIHAYLDQLASHVGQDLLAEVRMMAKRP